MRLIVIGSGDYAGADDQMPALRRIVAELDVGDAVRFVGRVPERELELWYAAADVFALPSSSEGQGLAALEAMAAGLPVLASAVGGLLTTIDDGLTGALVASGDVSALTARLIELLGDGCLRARMGTAAREAVQKRFSWAKTVAETVAVYRELVPGARGRNI